MFYVNLPAAVRIFRSSTLGLWAFDADRTLCVMVGDGATGICTV